MCDRTKAQNNDIHDEQLELLMKSRPLKRYERDYECRKFTNEGELVLTGNRVDLANAKLLLAVDEFDQETFDQLFEVKTGRWYVEDGWVVGRNIYMFPGMIMSRDDYLGNIMFTVRAKLVPPSTHDINLTLHGDWDEEKNTRGNGYVACLGSFWHGLVGFEKSPKYDITVATHIFDFDPEKEYLFSIANIGSKILIIVDGQIVLSVKDPNPIDVHKVGKLGVEAFSSWFKFKDMRVYELDYKTVKEYYLSE